MRAELGGLLGFFSARAVVKVARVDMTVPVP